MTLKNRYGQDFGKIVDEQTFSFYFTDTFALTQAGATFEFPIQGAPGYKHYLTRVQVYGIALPAALGFPVPMNVMAFMGLSAVPSQPLPRVRNLVIPLITINGNGANIGVHSNCAWKGMVPVLPNNTWGVDFYWDNEGTQIGISFNLVKVEFPT